MSGQALLNTVIKLFFSLSDLMITHSSPLLPLPRAVFFWHVINHDYKLISHTPWGSLSILPQQGCYNCWRGEGWQFIHVRWGGSMAADRYSSQRFESSAHGNLCQILGGCRIVMSQHHRIASKGQQRSRKKSTKKTLQSLTNKKYLLLVEGF
jgi:hypothetical protein